jgi:hypothetical protein
MIGLHNEIMLPKFVLVNQAFLTNKIKNIKFVSTWWWGHSDWPKHVAGWNKSDRAKVRLLYFTFMWPCIVTNFFLIKPTDALISQICFCLETVHVSGSSSTHHQEFSTVHSALVYVKQVWWHVSVPNVQWKTPDDGQRNCPKHVEFLDKNKFAKLVRLLVFIKKETVTML